MAFHVESLYPVSVLSSIVTISLREHRVCLYVFFFILNALMSAFFVFLLVSGLTVARDFGTPFYK